MHTTSVHTDGGDDADRSLKRKTHISTGEVRHYEYDIGGNLVLAEHRPSPTADKRLEYTYDVLDNRIEKCAYPDGNAWAEAEVPPIGAETKRTSAFGALQGDRREVAPDSRTSPVRLGKSCFLCQRS